MSELVSYSDTEKFYNFYNGNIGRDEDAINVCEQWIKLKTAIINKLDEVWLGININNG